MLQQSKVTPNEEERLTRRNYSSFHEASLIRKIASKLWSIQILMLALFVFAIVITGVTVWLIGFINSNAGINEISQQSRSCTVNNVFNHIISYFSSGPEVAKMLQEHINTFPEALELSNDTYHKAVRTLYYMLKDEVQMTMLGRADGRMISLYRMTGGMIGTIFGDGEMAYGHIVDLKTGYKASPPLFSAPYDHREEPIWGYVVDKKAITWANVHVGYGDNVTDIQTNIQIAGPIFNETGHVVGITGSLFRLDFVSQYMSKLSLGSTGRVFLIERKTGNLLCASKGKLFKIEDGVPGLISATESDDEIIADAAKSLFEKFGKNLENLEDTTSTFFHDRHGDGQHVELMLLKDEYGIDWVTVLTVADSELKATIYRSNLITLIFSIADVVIALGISICFSLMITLPLNRTKRALRELADMNFSNQLKKRKFDMLQLHELKLIDSSVRALQIGLTNFEKFVPSDVAKNIVRSNRSVELKVETRNISVLFCDIIGFTRITETTEPNEMVKFLGDFFTIMSKIIMDHNGTVDKYIGDAIMAFWNAPSEVPNHEITSVECALKCMKSISEFNEKWAHSNIPQINIRIGINTANCLVGNIGSPHRMNYTAVGDGVNIAARLEPLNNLYGTNLMIGEATFEKVKSKYLCRWLDLVCVKGKSKPINVYEVIGTSDEASPEALQECAIHEALGMALHDKDVNKAKDLALQLLKLRPSNEAAKVVLERMVKLSKEEDPKGSLANILTIK